MQKINLEGADNARDFGGTKTKNQSVIKPGILIRSNHLANLSADDVRMLSDQYHVRSILDLRTAEEVKEKPDQEIAGASWQHLPLFEAEAVGITHETSSDLMMALGTMPDMPKLYRRIVSDGYSVSRLAAVFHVILNQENGAVLWHCTEGKDRCGIVSALTLELLEVDRDTIFADYLATNQASSKRADAYEKKVLEKTGDRELAKKVRSMFLAEEAYLRSAFDEIETECGSTERFFEEKLGIGREEKARFRERCLTWAV